jgi:hypothetical protein
MSSVFGIMTVEGNRISKDGRIILDCFDPDLKERKIVYSNRALLVGTKLYWEFDCRTFKTTVKLL